MTVNKCNTCFFQKMDKELEAPCTGCTGYSNWTPQGLHMDTNTLKESIDDWFKKGYNRTEEDFWTDPDPEYDTVNKPKHYMLFKKEGIEVRDVIEKLVSKIEYMPNGLFTADYVQMMQYLMRFMDKNGVEDLKKASWYLDKMIDAYDSDF